MLELLLQKIEKKEAIICILGLGRVGLPLASVFATKGMKVVGVDVNENRIKLIENSKCPFYDPSLQKNLEEAIKIGNLSVKKTLNELSSIPDIFIITVGTPISSDNSVDYSQLFNALNEITNFDLKEKMIILRSTLPPKTTTEIVIPHIEAKTSLKVGTDIAVAVCPERILEGKAIEEINSLPEIIGGVNEDCNSLAIALFKILNPEKEFLSTTPSGAELAKLFANIYRYIGFALANEFAIWSEQYGLDGSEIIKIANHNYSRSNIPIPGFAGGPCLSKDGLFLDNNTTFSSIVSTAWKLNESIPQHIVNNIKKSVGNLYNKKIAILGISFKAGSDDIRNSPSVKLAEILKSTGAKVLIHDPYVKDTLSITEVLEKPDIVILATNHKEFSSISDKIEGSGCQLIYDVWSMFDKKQFNKIKYLRFGQGIN